MSPEEQFVKIPSDISGQDLLESQYQWKFYTYTWIFTNRFPSLKTS